MDLIKVYLIQSITSAANNLRLNAQQIEVVGLLRETILNSQDVGSEFLKMKKSTELSKLAIRLGEIHSFLTQGKVDFIKISEQFREHSRYLIRDLNQFLENISPQVYKTAFNKINNGEAHIIDIELVDRSSMASQIMVGKDEEINKIETKTEEGKQVNSLLDFEKKILEPIKPLNELLMEMSSGKDTHRDLKEFCKILEDNATLSNQGGFKTIAKMHTIAATSLNEILIGNLPVNKSVIEAIRACLIVIVALVKKKEVDISGYLKRAEEFGNKYLKTNSGVNQT